METEVQRELKPGSPIEAEEKATILTADGRYARGHEGDAETLVKREPLPSDRTRDGNGIFAHRTVFEEVLLRLPVPYVASVLFMAMFIGPLGDFLFHLSVSSNLEAALYGISGATYEAESGFVASVPLALHSLVSNAIWYAFLFYCTFLVRYIRMRLVKAEEDLVSLAPEGKRTIHEVFRVVLKTWPQLALTLVFLVIYATSVQEVQNIGQFTALSTPIYVFRSLFRSLVLGSVLWVCLSSLWSLYRFGKLPLRFKSYHEDRMLGAKELGSLSFSLTSAYFMGLTLFTAQTILGGLAGHTVSINLVIILFLVPIGIVLFLAPLVSAHRRMVVVKKAELASTRKLFSKLTSDIEQGGIDDPHMIKLLTLEAWERKATSIRTWPVENPVVGKLSVIAMSVTAIMIARLVQVLLHI